MLTAPADIPAAGASHVRPTKPAPPISLPRIIAPNGAGLFPGCVLKKRIFCAAAFQIGAQFVQQPFWQQ
jgi:hypothetical protein